MWDFPENTYLFARPSSLICCRGSDILRYFAKTCGAKCPESLTLTKLRKQTGTLSQVLNLTNAELDQLADFLGHDIRVYRQFYRLPEGSLQLAKISKVLMALEQRRLSEFKGKCQDDININPEGTKYLIVPLKTITFPFVFQCVNIRSYISNCPENVHLDSDQDSGAPCDSEAAFESDTLGEFSFQYDPKSIHYHVSKGNHFI